MKLISGKTYRCVDAQSKSYTKGKTYLCFKGEEGKPSLKGDDGFEDTGQKLVSKFKEITRPILSLVLKGDK